MGSAAQIEDDHERRRKLEIYLDRGCGECHLRRANVARLIEAAFRFYHGRWYDQLAWVVMPNHVHLLVETGNTSLSKIVKELKRYTAREANKILRHDGVFWAEDYFDTYMRDAEHELKTRRYIENNPVKAFRSCVNRQNGRGAARDSVISMASFTCDGARVVPTRNVSAHSSRCGSRQSALRNCGVRSCPNSQPFRMFQPLRIETIRAPANHFIISSSVGFIASAQIW